MPGNDLRKLYCGLVRSVVEYSSVTYGPILSKSQDDEIENIQKRCLRCMYRYDKTYSQLLEESKLETLRVRRAKAITKFARNSLSNPVYTGWFPANCNRKSNRMSKKFEERFARTNRLYNSPIYAYRRNLNETEDKEEPEKVTNWNINLNDPFLD